jgi:hypothetical protein
MFKDLFNVFSKRSDIKEKIKPLTQEFRIRTVMLFRDIIGNEHKEYLQHLHKKLTYLHGKPVLIESKNYNDDIYEDVIRFFNSCSDEHFLDTIEYSFQINNYRYLTWFEKDLVDPINEFFKIDNLPYYLTNSAWEECESEYPFHGAGKATRVKETPKIIRKDSEILHKMAIVPTLTLLQDNRFLNANEEFLLALEDYKKNDYRDCVVKCGSALESVMKIICNEKNISYSEDKDTASVLIKKILQYSNLDNFWEQPIILIATIRNRLSSAHGKGTKEKSVPEHIAKYTINATASIILLLCDELL